MHAEEILISGDDYSTRNLNQEIKKGLKENQKNFWIENSQKLDSVAVGIREEAYIKLEGDFGDFLGALNDGAKIEVQGRTGRYLGNTMTDGEIIIHGSTDEGAGFGMYDGTIVIHGNSGDGVGQLNKGGLIVVNGDIGNLAGLYMLSGDLIVTGNAGEDTGEWIIGGTIYVGGDFQTGTNAQIKPLDKSDKEKLSRIFKTYNISTDLDKFQKIQHMKARPFYG